MFFKNPNVNDSIYGNQPDEVIESERYLKKYRKERPEDYSYTTINYYAKGNNPPKPKHKKSSNKTKKLRSKSCQLSAK